MVTPKCREVLLNSLLIPDSKHQVYIIKIHNETA